MEAPDDLDRLIQEALVQLGCDADPTRLAHKVKLLNLGLPAEDEFSVICAWLGQCRLIHKLDQLQAPAASNKTLQVPDLMAQLGRGERGRVRTRLRSGEADSLPPHGSQDLRRLAPVFGVVSADHGDMRPHPL